MLGFKALSKFSEREEAGQYKNIRSERAKEPFLPNLFPNIYSSILYLKVYSIINKEVNNPNSLFFDFNLISFG
ncbi:MAG: hypothetical protein AMJ42_01245 [Deltaproteobacteria bacterium DG_8]|nr:MAG: hypothetical protein AMJ42_01245 [Deltaproteobacteria bacterium DG_8]